MPAHINNWPSVSFSITWPAIAIGMTNRPTNCKNGPICEACVSQSLSAHSIRKALLSGRKSRNRRAISDSTHASLSGDTSSSTRIRPVSFMTRQSDSHYKLNSKFSILRPIFAGCRMKKLYRFVVLGVAASSLGLTGCGLVSMAYSGVKWAQGGVDRAGRGQARRWAMPVIGPALLPIMKYDDIFKPENQSLPARPGQFYPAIRPKFPRPNARTGEGGRRAIRARRRIKPSMPRRLGIDIETIKKLMLDDETPRRAARAIAFTACTASNPGDDRPAFLDQSASARLPAACSSSVGRSSHRFNETPRVAQHLARTHPTASKAPPCRFWPSPVSARINHQFVMRPGIRGQTEMDVSGLQLQRKAGGLPGIVGPTPTSHRQAALCSSSRKKLVCGGWKPTIPPRRSGLGRILTRRRGPLPLRKRQTALLGGETIAAERQPAVPRGLWPTGGVQIRRLGHWFSDTSRTASSAAADARSISTIASTPASTGRA